MSNFTIFISSADAYSDLWQPFFDLFKKNWSEYNGVIYLNTETKTFEYNGLDIRCTQVGNLGEFGRTLRAGLDCVDSENIMLIMIDYLFMGKVNNDKVESYYEFFVKHNLDSLCLTYQNYPNIKNSENRELNFIYPPAPRIMFSYQISFWKKSMFYQMALPHENPWASEWYGSLRAEAMNIKLAAISEHKYNCIPYDLAGCLHKGQWLENAIDYLNQINYKFDFDKRGYFENKQHTIKQKLKLKYMLVKAGLKGSYIDLYNRHKSN